MSRSSFKRLALMGFAAVATMAHADAVGPRVALLPAYQQECAACHLAYPPGMLPAASWQRVMGSLGQHFGTDASLDEASVRAISAWLTTQAGTSRRMSEPPPQDRITRSAWFVREHDEILSAVWKRPAIGSASNCAACHGSAAQGRFNEHEVKIPR